LYLFIFISTEGNSKGLHTFIIPSTRDIVRAHLMLLDLINRRDNMKRHEDVNRKEGGPGELCIIPARTRSAITEARTRHMPVRHKNAAVLRFFHPGTLKERVI
jgi:hypothetical protein